MRGEKHNQPAIERQTGVRSAQPREVTSFRHTSESVAKHLLQVQGVEALLSDRFEQPKTQPLHHN